VGPTRSRLIVAGLVALLAVPLVVALIAVKHPKWYPIWDLALTEMQLRDVGSIHTPLTSVGGRVGAGNELGSHPGPLGFYMMFPAYRVFGASSWAMQVAAVSVHVAAVGAILFLCARRRSLALLLGMAAVLAFLIRATGAELLTQAWNPSLPMLWWIVFLVAVWLVVCGDLPMLPVAIFAGSFCVQNHAGYVVLVTGLAAFAVASVWLPAYTHRTDGRRIHEVRKWTLIAVGVSVAVWIPPVLEQISGEGDNLGILWRHVRNWDEEPVGLWRGFQVVLQHLNPWRLLTDGIFVWIRGSTVPGAVILAVWATMALIAVRLRHAALVRLHAVLAVALLLAVVTISRLGFVFWYLLLWMWGIHALVLLAIGWTLVVVIRRRTTGTARQAATKLAGGAVAATTVVLTVVFAFEAVDVVYDRRDSMVLDALVPQTVSALEREGDRSYFVQWDHATTGALGRGLMNELDRRGFDVGAAAQYRAEVRPHRVMAPEEADAVIAVVGGPDIATWRAAPGVRQIAYVDLTGAQQAGVADGSGTAVFEAPPP
jgi:hypothetical protein